jgi:site-specific DNA recombinase
VLALLENPQLIKTEIDRRLHALRAEHPATRRRDGLQRDLTRAQNALRRLIDGYQEQLITLEELRARTPELRRREATLRAELDTLNTDLHDAETYLKLTETLDAFRARSQPTQKISPSSSANRSCDSSCARSCSATTTSPFATQSPSRRTDSQTVR